MLEQNHNYLDTTHTTGAISVKNAGLIILHPFLPRFLINCQLLDESNTITDEKLALGALHYLATKNELRFRNDLVFENFICGLPLDNAIQEHNILSDFVKLHAEELLQSVIKHWGVFGNLSTDVLRDEFLQREGMLHIMNDNPKLIIERKPQDILIDQLAWGIGISKLPWLNTLIFTQW